ncbi:AAA family ATPase [Bradyrhizobium liaoningense]|uniref:AAA family ATPase n=1 Tax=Bradyrhizobium liaoningense TaxID=43992 RepID=UPI0004B96BF3|nr:AAA family ATPase [Bradyrhizobium liaoningense]
MNMAPTGFSPTTFEAFFKLGYTRLVPIVPHDATISDKSSLALRVGTDQDSRGKAVGVKGPNGWYGFDWLPHEADERDLQRWQAMGAGIGIKTGQGIVGIDADTMNLDHASLIQMTAVKHFGMTPVRIGNFPKALYLVGISEPMKYTRVEFGPLDARGRLKDRVEILSDGRQFVAHGIHPKTLKPYTWTRPLVARSALPTFSPAQIIAFLEELRTLLPAAKPLIVEGATTDVSQASLKGSIDTVRKAVAATPNNSKAFGTREAYRDYGYAIKAALPDNEPEAFEIFAEWCARWEDGDNDPGIVAADWRRMKGPYRRGANWIYELAERENPEAFKKVDAFFDVIPVEESLFINESLPRLLETPVAIKWVDPNEWEGVTPPKRRWVVDGMIPDGEVTLLTGAGGVGKTLLAQQAATCISQGLPFLGRKTQQCKVMLFLCEDSEDELQLRQRDINLSMGLDLADLSGSLRIASRKFMDNLLAIWTSNTGAMKRTAVWQALRDDALAFGAKLIVVDTIADTFGGNEIDRSHVRQFVQACLGKLAQETGGAVLALGHPSKAGQAVGGDGTSGSTAWHASVRSRLYLQHAAKDKTGPFRRLENMKANYGAGGDVFMLRWLRGAFDLVSAKTMGADGDAPGEAAEGVASAVPATGDVIEDAILMAVRELAAEGVALSKAPNSPHWAPRVFKRSSDALGIYMMDDIEAGWNRVLKAGRVRVAVVGRKPHNRHPIVGFNVVYAAPTEPAESIFG